MPETTALVDNLDIFIIPQINGDGATHSLYDSNRRKNLSNYCEDTTKFPSNDTDPAQRNSWGVDMNRNFQVGSVFDGFQGASTTDCLSGNFAGLFEHSEPEVRNETWVQTTFRNIKFANNIHSNGGLFMWPPGAYTPGARAAALPAVRHAELLRPDRPGTSSTGSSRTAARRSVPQQTGPVIDVLYSAAGNSADEAYYANGIIGFDFEIGDHPLLQGPGDRRRSRAAAPASSRRSATRRTTASTTRASTRRWSTPAATTACCDAAMAYGDDTTAPGRRHASWQADVRSRRRSTRCTSRATRRPRSTTRSTARRPTTASTEWKPPRARALPLPLDRRRARTLKWIATDFKGNVSAVKAQVLGQVQAPGTVGGTVPATLA